MNGLCLALLLSFPSLNYLLLLNLLQIPPSPPPLTMFRRLRGPLYFKQLSC